MGPAPHGAFVQVNGSTLESEFLERQILKRLRAADRGTLLLAHLDQMDLRSQRLLGQILEIGPAVWAARQGGGPVAVRLLATASQVSPDGAPAANLDCGLVEQLDFLRIEIEPLRNRREDLPPLIEHYLRRYACGTVPEISGEFLQACNDYDWPGDVAELSRVMARLAVMAEGERLLPSHLHSQIPGLPETRGASSNAPRPPDARGRGRPGAWAIRSPGLDACHPSLQRAITYIAAHSAARLSLAQVAARAYVSSSHLAHLFHQDLGTTFTRFLSSLRIDRAQHLLLERPWEAITTIAAESGFADLRHFERTFKGLVGCTPKEFRRISGACGQALEPRPQSLPH